MPRLTIKTSDYIKSMIAELGKPYVSGSSAREGWSYLPIPFQDFEDTPHHRLDAYDRFDAILMRIPLKDRHIVDLGCATGFFSFAMIDAGAREVIGVEYDKKAYNVCQSLKLAYSYSDSLHFIWGFVEQNLDYVQDIVLAMSIAHWIRISDGDEAMTHFLSQLALRSKIAFIELPIKGSGGAGIPWLQSEDEVFLYLTREIGFRHVESLIDVSSHAGTRRTWMCSSNVVP